MKLFQFVSEDNLLQIGISLKGETYNFTKLSDTQSLDSLQTMVTKGLFNVEFINEIIEKAKISGLIDSCIISGELKIEVPIANPQKILCFGVNYAAHAAESDNPIPDEPILFVKTANTLLPHNGTIVFPKSIGQVDHEIELALIISKKGKNIPEEKAHEFIAGYTIINDVSARKMQVDDMKKAHPWYRSKSYDTFCPIGPFLIPSGAIKDPNNIDLTLKINDEIKQHSNTSRMIFKIPQLIAFASRIVTLMPGDIICTGTPDGISEIKDGDVVTCELTELGLLSNSVKAI